MPFPGTVYVLLTRQVERPRQMPKETIRIAAIADVHIGKTSVAGAWQPLFAQITEQADVLLICGDLTDYGLPEEARARPREYGQPENSGRRCARQPRLRINGPQAEIQQTSWTLVYRSSTARRWKCIGIGFAGMKGFAGGSAAACSARGERTP